MGLEMIENSKYTIMAMEKTYTERTTDWEDYLFDSTEYAMELDGRNPVLEGIVDRLNQLGVQVCKEDKKIIMKELKKRYICMGIQGNVLEGIKKNNKTGWRVKRLIPHIERICIICVWHWKWIQNKFVAFS